MTPGTPLLASSAQTLREEAQAPHTTEFVTKFRDKHMLSLEKYLAEPTEILWHNFGPTLGERFIRGTIAFLLMIVALFSWTALIYSPSLLYALSLVRLPGVKGPSALVNLVLGSVIGVGNGVIAFLVHFLAEWVRFTTTTTQDSFILVGVFLLQLLNVGLSLFTVLLYNQKKLPWQHSLDKAFVSEESYRMYPNFSKEGPIDEVSYHIGQELTFSANFCSYIIPGVILLPPILNVIGCYVIPSIVNSLWVLYDSRISLRTAERMLQCPGGLLPYKYAEPLVAITSCCSLLLLVVDAKDVMWVFASLTAVCLFIQYRDRYLFLRESKDERGNTTDLDDWNTRLWVVPTGILAVVPAYWICRLNNVVGWWILFAVFGVHAFVYFCMLGLAVPKLLVGNPSEASGERPGREMSAVPSGREMSTVPSRVSRLPRAVDEAAVRQVFPPTPHTPLEPVQETPVAKVSFAPGRSQPSHVARPRAFSMPATARDRIGLPAPLMSRTNQLLMEVEQLRRMTAGAQQGRGGSPEDSYWIATQVQPHNWFNTNPVLVLKSFYSDELEKELYAVAEFTVDDATEERLVPTKLDEAFRVVAESEEALLKKEDEEEEEEEESQETNPRDRALSGVREPSLTRPDQPRRATLAEEQKELLRSRVRQRRRSSVLEGLVASGYSPPVESLVYYQTGKEYLQGQNFAAYEPDRSEALEVLSQAGAQASEMLRHQTTLSRRWGIFGSSPASDDSMAHSSGVSRLLRWLGVPRESLSPTETYHRLESPNDSQAAAESDGRL
eukprot:GHVT01045814.1.p1 GENE.GHVT01045814.1~~GHVT01045814.1.p1  ORF type:complete len:908 (+),score=100.81 GHVT01045814.1:383-2725(+)